MSHLVPSAGCVPGVQGAMGAGGHGCMLVPTMGAHGCHAGPCYRTPATGPGYENPATGPGYEDPAMGTRLKDRL